jgi:hypothetical protein
VLDSAIIAPVAVHAATSPRDPGLLGAQAAVRCADELRVAALTALAVVERRHLLTTSELLLVPFTSSPAPLSSFLRHDRGACDNEPGAQAVNSSETLAGAAAEWRWH